MGLYIRPQPTPLSRWRGRQGKGALFPQSSLHTPAAPDTHHALRQHRRYLQALVRYLRALQFEPTQYPWYMNSITDVFVGHDAADAETVRAFAVALQAHGISASFDPLRDEREESLRRIGCALGHCKLFVAWGSRHFHRQRALQWEFTAAFAAAARRGTERARIVVMDLDPDSAALPLSIAARVRMQSVSATTQEALNALAARLAEHLSTLEGPIVDAPQPLPICLPYAVFGSDRFADRAPELWRIHEFFTDPARDAESGLRAIQLIGPAGAGKSMLAQEYAERFATAYPGGIFWLDAGSLRIDSAAELQAAREHAWCEFAARLGLPMNDRGFGEVADGVRQYLAERALPFLWIVDHAPAGHFIDTIRSWLAPHPLGDTILLARCDDYAPLGPQIHIETLHATPPDTVQQNIVRLGTPARQCLRMAAILADAPVPIALAMTALAQQSRTGMGTLAEAELAVEELLDARLVTRVNDEYFALVPGVRSMVLEADTPGDLDAARDVAALTLASELMQAPQASYANPCVRWIPHVLQIAETAAASSHLVEVIAWLARFETVGALRTINRRALHRLREGDVIKAQELLDLELTATRRGLGEDHPATITSANNLGAVLGLQGDFSGARTLFEHALEVRGKVLGEQHPDTLTPLNNLAVMLWSESDLDGAHALFECVVEHRRRWLGERHPETLVAMKNLAVTLRERGDYVGARTLLEHVVETRRTVLGVQHPDTRAAMGSLARTLSEEGAAVLHRADRAAAQQADALLPGEERSGEMTAAGSLLIADDAARAPVRLSS